MIPHKPDIQRINAVDVEEFKARLDRACEVCECTEYLPCENGCSWDSLYIAEGRYVCTNCIEEAPDRLDG